MQFYMVSLVQSFSLSLLHSVPVWSLSVDWSVREAMLASGNGEVPPNGSFHLSLGNSGGQDACPKQFESCWNEEDLIWRNSTRCDGAKAACRQILCAPQYLDDYCSSASGTTAEQCAHVASMCQKEDELHQARVRAYRHSELGARSDSSSDLVFLHIPKNAGTTVEQAGSLVGISWGDLDPGLHSRQLMPDGNMCSRWHVPPRLAGAPSQYSSAEVFCITRHPYERAVSEYKYLLSVPWGRLSGKQWHARLDAFPACSPEGLNYFIQHAIVEMRKHRYVFDCHLIPQTDYIWDAAGQPTCHDVLRIADLPVAFDELMERKGNPARIPDEIENAHHDACSGLSVENLTWRSKAMMNEVYAEDFKKLNYTATTDTYVESSQDAQNGAAKLHFSGSVVLVAAFLATVL